MGTQNWDDPSLATLQDSELLLEMELTVRLIIAANETEQLTTQDVDRQLAAHGDAEQPHTSANNL
jgi:hypothetical protein